MSAKARQAVSLEELKALRDQLDVILEAVVVALDTDDVTEEGFQSFSLLWESVRDTIRDRRAELVQRPVTLS